MAGTDGRRRLHGYVASAVAGVCDAEGSGAAPMSRLLRFTFVAAIACALGCGGGGPECNNTCARAGATQCSGAQVQTCTADANGCLAFSAAAPCATGSFCSAGANACVACVNTCAAVGASLCSATQVQTCTADANGCLSLGAPAPIVRPVGTSALPAAQVNHIGTKTVGDVVQFTIPPGTGGFSIGSPAGQPQPTAHNPTLRPPTPPRPHS